MNINLDELRSLSKEEKLRLIELLWDELGSDTEPIPLPEWVGEEAAKRRDEMLQDPSLGLGLEVAKPKPRRRATES